MRKEHAFTMTIFCGLVAISGSLFSQTVSANGHDEMIKSALDSCGHYIFPNSMARLPGRDWAKYDHDNYLRYASIAQQFATNDGLIEIVNFMLNDKKSKKYEWSCALDMVGRSGSDDAIPILQKYRDRGSDLVDYYLQEYKTRPSGADWKPTPYINYHGQ